MPSSASEEHTSELQSHDNLVCRLLLEKKKKMKQQPGAAIRPHTIRADLCIMALRLPPPLASVSVLSHSLSVSFLFFFFFFFFKGAGAPGDLPFSPKAALPI